MKINVTASRSGYVYATAPFKFGRFEQTDVFVFLVPLVICTIIQIDPVDGFFVGLTVLYLYKRFTRDQLPGHGYLYFSNLICSMAAKNRYGHIAFVRATANIIGTIWKKGGSLPPPTYINFHER